MQRTELHPEIDQLQLQYGAPELSAIYGAGCVKNPEVMLMFMNPTGRNIAANKEWGGLRAPWIGTKNIWPLLHEVGMLSDVAFALTRQEWTEQNALTVYEDIALHKIYITNLAKCTQLDARHLSDSVFRTYLANTIKEIIAINPKRIITFGNQVSSIILNRSISVSSYKETQSESFSISDKSFDVYPVYYPVGQGRRNQPLAVKRIKAILK